MLFRGEEEAVRQVLQLAETYGYGNLIAHLKRGWALHLMKGNDRLSYENALHATDVSAYPQDFGIDEMTKETK